METVVKYYKFVKHHVPEPIFSIEDPKEFIKNKYQNRFNFGMDNILKDGVFKLGGYAYNLQPFLKKYLLKQYGSWSEYYAPNKTALRKVIFGRIETIIEYK